jgi:hypothetical protein
MSYLQAKYPELKLVEERITPEQRQRNALLAAGLLASKGKTPQEAIVRWNGQGPGAMHHYAKVQEAQRMLSTKENKVVWDTYQRYLKEAQSQYPLPSAPERCTKKAEENKEAVKALRSKESG